MSSKTPPPNQPSRKERRAAENRERFEAAREERRNRAAARGGKSSSGTSSYFGIITIGAVVIGVAIIAILAVNQLGGRGGSTEDLRAPSFTYPVALIDGHTVGEADAPVTLEVVEDFQCPVCARHSLTVEPILVNRYVLDGTLRIVKRDLAFLGRGGPGDESVIAASAASCAEQQDQYFDMSSWLYENQAGENDGGFRRERVDAIAEAAGLEMDAYTACMDDAATRAGVEQRTNELTSEGINSTPSMRINGGEWVSGLQTVDALSAAIEAAAAAAGSPSPSTAP